MEKEIKWVLVLLLIFALLMPIIVFKSTGLTVLQQVAGVPVGESYVQGFGSSTGISGEFSYSIGIGMVKFPEGIATKNYPVWMSEVRCDGAKITYGTDWKEPLLFADKLDGCKPREATAVFSREGKNWLYAGHWYDAPRWWLPDMKDMNHAMLGARVWTEAPEHVFDFMVPGSILAAEGWTGFGIRDMETARVAFSGTLKELKAKLLGADVFSMLSQLTDDEINSGFQLEEAPIFGNQMSLYGVFRVPTYIEFWGETGTAKSKLWVPDTEVKLLVKVPTTIPASLTQAVNPLGLEPDSTNFQVLGVWDGLPLAKSEWGQKLQWSGVSVADFERLFLGSVNLPGPIEEFVEKTFGGMGITAPDIKFYKDGEWKDLPETFKLKFFDVSLIRAKVTWNPRLEYLTPNQFFDYTFFTDSVTKEGNYQLVQVTLKIIGGTSKKHWHEAVSGATRVRIRVDVPIAWVAQVKFKPPSQDKLSSVTETWFNALADKLKKPWYEIASRLKMSMDDVVNKLKQMGLWSGSVSSLTGWSAEAAEKLGELSGKLDGLSTLFETKVSDLRSWFEEQQKSLQSSFQTEIEKLKATIVTPEELERKLAEAQAKYQAALADLQSRYDSQIRDIIAEITKPEVLPKYLVEVSETIQSANLPTVADLLGSYARPITSLDFIPTPAELPTPEEIAWMQEREITPYVPKPISIKLPKPIGTPESAYLVTYTTEVNKPEYEVTRSNKSSAEPYTPTYTASMYVRDAALMVAVVLGSVGAGILALRVLRKR